MEEIPQSLNLSFMEGLYEDFLNDPASVDPDWRQFFASWNGSRPVPAHGLTGPPFRARSLFNPPGEAGAGLSGDLGRRTEQHRVDQLIRNYRVRAHRVARVDPLESPLPHLPELDPEYFGFTEADMDKRFSVEGLGGANALTLREIITRLRNTYCRSIGVQFMHIDDLFVRQWLQERMEGSENRLSLKREEQLRILTRLTDAVIFEEFIQRKYIGAKRFSLEGAESLIPLLDLAIEKAGEQGIEEIVIGMAHRGRINVLANIMGKSPRLIFREFEDKDPHLHIGRGDVKYHLGYHTDWNTASGRSIHIALCPNPSHLEYVNGVALGRMRAKQDRLGDARRERGMVILVHGDASFTGEGIVQETLNLSQLEGYAVGGTLHVVVNNQIGFTTSPSESRSCVYATDPAKMLQIPIFHVNGEDPEAVAQALNLGMEFRAAFKRDVVIDMYCYRRYGHNETDEPAFTHPVLYREIKNRKSVREGYLDHLLKLGEVKREEADEIARKRREHLEEELRMTQSAETETYLNPARPSVTGRVWGRYKGGFDRDVEDVDTAAPRERLVACLEALARTPEDFQPHPKIQRILEQRLEMARGERLLDWAAGEALALATLAVEGYRVRLSGQDSGRGTFSHRHAILHDYRDGRPYESLQHVAPGQAPVEIVNSPLSEAGVLGFEYGYSWAWPDGLVLWEAQFGDFCNAGQVIVDQFLASAEDKWGTLSGLTLLLPHGFEGLGPEHSSARLERFLLLAAENNIQIVNPTTPAQMFHVLRRQVLRPWRKPLVVMTPKSLLRNPVVVSPLEELASGRFERVLGDPEANPEKTERILLCSGKIYYDLVQYRQEKKREDVAIVRLEQLYPIWEDRLGDALSRCSPSAPLFWVQEEPENMGAWRYIRTRFGERLLGRWPLKAVTREPSASPATGSPNAHKMEQQELLRQAFEGD
jgi:2-oxoglutarate dehydrogenase E1 component